MELTSISVGMHPRLHTEFAALLARAAVTNADFARLTGVTTRQVNNGCRGRAAVPRWAAMFASPGRQHPGRPHHHGRGDVRQLPACGRLG
jgi:hypothetical protein